MSVSTQKLIGDKTEQLPDEKSNGSGIQQVIREKISYYLRRPWAKELLESETISCHTKTATSVVGIA